MPAIIKAGTRPSLLALKQAEEIKGLIPGFIFEVIPIETAGDKDKTTPLIHREESDFFTDAIEEALLAGDIDIGIHSAKDLEVNMPDELVIIALTESISPYECLISRDGLTLERLPAGSRIATSSYKRRDAILRFRPELEVRGIRGNIVERLGQLDNGQFDALIVAHAALIRLGYEERIAQIIPDEVITAHPLQGRLAVQARRDRPDLRDIFRRLHAG